MRKVIVFGVPVKVHPALPLMFALALWLVAKSYVSTAGVFLILHEAAHAFAARRMNLRLLELELMPLGGAARIDGIWLLRPSQIAKVSLVGPLMNLFLAIVFAALGWFFPIHGEILTNAIQINALLFFFNLLPALPLDGGRIFCALIANRIGPERAVRIGVRFGYGLAAIFLAGAALLFFAGGKLNLPLIVCAFYLIACAPKELNEARGASLLSMIDREGELGREGALPIAWLAVPLDAPVSEVARRMRPGRLYRFAAYREMDLVGIVEEKMFRESLLKNPNISFCDIINSNFGNICKNRPNSNLQ